MFTYVETLNNSSKNVILVRKQHFIKEYMFGQLFCHIQVEYYIITSKLQQKGGGWLHALINRNNIMPEGQVVIIKTEKPILIKYRLQKQLLGKK